MIRNTTMLLIVIGVSLLALVYMYYSKKLNKPVQMLKETMSCIERVIWMQEYILIQMMSFRILEME